MDARNSGGRTPLHYGVWRGACTRTHTRAAHARRCAAGWEPRGGSASARVCVRVRVWTLVPARPPPQASKGNPKLVGLLLGAGADINARDATGSTALHRAASAGARPDGCQPKGPAAHARVCMHTHLCLCLKRARDGHVCGSHVTATPAGFGRAGKLEAVRALLQHGKADVNARDGKGAFTPGLIGPN